MRKLFRCAMVFMLIFAAPVIAQTVDESAISKLLHTTFDQPQAPLTIASIVVAGNYAIAGWAQGDMGGRALLRRKDTPEFQKFTPKRSFAWCRSKLTRSSAPEVSATEPQTCTFHAAERKYPWPKVA
jgi:hypothetical protein